MRVLLIIAYDGTDFHGYANNFGVRTVEGVLSEAICDLTNENIMLIGASRTDAGVHSLCNVAVFDTSCNIPADKYRDALNTKLPGDLRVTLSYEVPEDFHPRHADVRKIYEYTIYQGAVQPPIRRKYSWHIYQALDVGAMRKAAKHIMGKHDFTSFCSNNGNDVPDKVRDVQLVDVSYRGAELIIKVIGNGFLYNMVRIIVGTLVDVGLGRINADDVQGILAAKDRRQAGRTAPAHGLCLMRIEYM